MKAPVLYATLCLTWIWPSLSARESPCEGEKPRCAGIAVSADPGESYPHFFDIEGDAEADANNWDVGYEFNEERQQWVVFHPNATVEGVIPCPPRKSEPPPADSPEHNAGEMNMTLPTDEDEDSGCAQCGGGGSNPQITQDGASPTAMNVDFGLGRDATGLPYGRLRFGFDMAGSASTLRQALSLDYAPAAGKFVLEEFQPNSFTKTFRTDGRPQVFQNDNVTLTFYWTITNGIATEVLLYFAPKATVAGTPRDFQPVSVSLKYSTQGTFGTQPKITITHTGLASKTMSIEGLATSPTEYQWRMNKFDGSIVDGTSSMLLGDELAALRQEFGDPTMEVRVASAETTPAVPGAPPVVARSYFKTNTGDADHPALLKKRVVTTGSGQDSVTQTTKWTHHENPDPAQLFQKNLVSSMTYPDGTWVAYPTYDSVTKKPTVELRPWLDGPATPTAALADPNSCRKTQTEWWIKDLTEVDSDLKGAYVLPEFRHRKVIESAGGTVLSIEQIGTHACLANQLGGPFAGGGELAALSSDLAIIQGRVKWDPNSQTFSSYVKVMSDGAAFGNGDTAAFSGEFDSNTGIFTLRKSLDGKPGYPNEGSYEIQTWNAILNEVHDGDKTFGSVTILSRQPRATRYVASSGGSISEIREVLYSGPEDTVGTVVSTTSFESLSGHTKTTKNGVVVRDEYQTYATLNGKGVVKTLITDADGSESITWEDVGTGEIVQTQSPSGIIKTISHSGMTTTTSISNTTNSFQARESETRDKQGRMVSAIDRNQRVTEWSYSEDGLITTETLPGGATRITSYYKDGQLKSITGTAVVPEYHTYEVNDGTLDQPIGFRPSGSITNVIHTGSATSVRVRWVTRDFQGRVIAEQTVAPPPVSGTVGKITKLYRFSDDQGLEFGSLKSVTIAGSGVEDFTQRVDTTGMGSFIEVQRKAVGTSDYQRRETTRSHVSLNAPGYPSANSYWWSQDTATEYGLGSSGNQSRTSIVRSALNLPGRNSATVTIDPRGSLSLREVVYNNVEGGTKNRVENLKVGLATGNVSLGIVSTFTYQGDLLVSSVEGGVTSQHVYHHSGLLAGLKTSSAGSTVYAISRNFRTVSGPSNTTLQTDEVATETRYGVTTTYSYDSAGRVILAVSPAGSVRYAYDIAGRLTHQWGATYPVAYSYSSIDGQLVSMRTYREGTGFVDTTNATVPAAFDSEPASVTTWVYDEASGALVGKTDHGGRAVTYRYDAQGRLAQRIWARGVTVTYGYDAAGRLSSQVYSDATPAVGWTYNPGGQVLSVTDGSGSHLTSFGTGGSATYPAGESYQPLDADFSLGISRPANIFQNAGTSSTGWKRAQNLTITRNPAGPFNMSTLVNTTHTYAPGGLLETVEADGVRFTYGSYLGNIARTLSVSALNSAGSFTPVPYTTMNKTVATSFGKAFGKVTSIKYGASGTAPESGANLNYFSGWSYTFDSAGRRSTVTSAATGANIRPGWNWGYNARSEVVSTSRPNGTTSQAMETYAFDAIGNRVSMKPTGGSPVTEYAVSTVDPTAYSIIERPAQAWVSGHVSGAVQSGTVPIVTLADAGGLAQDVTIAAESTTAGDAGSYRRQFQVTNPKANVGFFGLQTTVATDATGATNTAKSWVYVPPVHEVLVHDEDGNLRRDARWQYHWDAENRLVMMEERPGIATYPSGAGDAPARQRLEFFYDAQSRRSAKRVFHWDAAANDWKPWAYTLFLYDGWNVVAELDLLNGGTPTRTYTWGTDLSNTMAGAGGVGGLLMVKRWQRNANGDASLRALVHSDANGNVMGLYGIEAQAMLGVFDYDAFGNQVINTVAMGNDVCPIGFSSKYLDAETGHVQYQLRTYVPEWGRWLNRDRIEEQGGINMYGMVGNDAVNRMDLLGLSEIRKRDCRYWVYIGHTNDVWKQHDNNGLNDGDRACGVTCHGSDINGENGLGGMGIGIPNTPSVDRYLYPEPLKIPKGYPEYDPAQDGDLDLYAFGAIANAEAQAMSACSSEDTCCKSIEVKVQCTQGNSLPAASSEGGWANYADYGTKGGAYKNPCGYSNKYDCKTKKWSGPRIDHWQTGNPTSPAKP